MKVLITIWFSAEMARNNELQLLTVYIRFSRPSMDATKLPETSETEAFVNAGRYYSSILVSLDDSGDAYTTSYKLLVW